MVGLVLGNELAMKHFQTVECIFSWECSAILNSSSPKVQTRKTVNLLCKNFACIVGNSGRFCYTEFQTFLPENVKSENCGKGTDNASFYNLQLKCGELGDNGSPKNREIAETKADESKWKCSSYPFRHKTTLHSANNRTKLFGNWAMKHVKL